MPGKSHGWRSLVGCSPWDCEESDTTEQLHFHFSLSCIGEGNGNPVQCSCLENPRNGRAWWAAVYGVAWSQTRLKRLSSSSSSRLAMATLNSFLVCMSYCNTSAKAQEDNHQVCSMPLRKPGKEKRVHPGNDIQANHPSTHFLGEHG